MAGETVILAPNWLGDAVMALPAIQSVIEASGGTPVTVAARPAVAPLFTLIGRSQVLRLEGRGRDLDTLRTPGFATAILFPNSFNAGRLVWRAGIGERWGYAGNLRSPLLTRAVVKPPRLHQLESYRRLVQALGFSGGDPVPRIDLPPSLHDEGRAFLMAAGWDGKQPLIAIAPGAAFGTAKRWPAAYFAELVARYAARGVATVMVGSASDASAGREVVSAVRPGAVTDPRIAAASPLIDLIGRTDLAMLAAVLVHVRRLVSNDSGAMHYAAALGVSVTVMVGPTIEKESRPIGRAPAEVITATVWCRPCMLRDCPLTHRCMREITVERVLAVSEVHA